MSKIQLTFQDENVINSIDLDHNSLPLNSSKRTANFRNNAFLSLRKFFSCPSPTHGPRPRPAPGDSGKLNPKGRTCGEAKRTPDRKLVAISLDEAFVSHMHCDPGELPSLESYLPMYKMLTVAPTQLTS